MKYRINDLQQVIIESIVKRNSDYKGYIKDMIDTFPTNTLCDMLKINRNRYNYLVRTDQLDNIIIDLAYEMTISKIVNYVTELKNKDVNTHDEE